MNLFKNLFTRKEKYLPTKSIDILDVNQPEVAASLLVMHYIETNYDLSDTELATFSKNLPPDLAQMAVSWSKIYMAWYFFIQMCSGRQQGFGDTMLAEIRRLMSKLDELPGGGGIGELLPYWFGHIHTMVERGPLELEGKPIPFEVMVATIFLYLDSESPLHGQEQTDLIEFDIAEVLIQARDAGIPAMHRILALGERLK